jgi:DNA-binding transcriptional regulator YhcF (GntR family)
VQELPFEIAFLSGQTKIQQLVHSITEAIVTGKLKKGDFLPSVNQMSAAGGCSRDTVFKAYKVLQERKLVESAPARGYYVTGESFKVFMLLDDFSAFKEQLYQSFRSNLPGSFSVDLLFHHYNREVFTQLVQNNIGRYSYYVIMNIDHKGIEPVLKKLNSGRLLILDMGQPDTVDISYIIQNFREAVESCMEEGLPHLKKYSEIIIVYDEAETPHPAETVEAVSDFCRKHGLNFRSMRKFQPGLMKEGQCWFTIRDADLVEVIKACHGKNWEAGKDIGVLSYNDTPMKQIVGGGISVISTDFEQMGILAAEFVKNGNKVMKVLPTSLILRESL